MFLVWELIFRIFIQNANDAFRDRLKAQSLFPVPTLNISTVCYSRFEHKLQELHKKGADLSALDQSGCSLLHHAVNTGSKEIVRYILDNGNNETFSL